MKKVFLYLFAASAVVLAFTGCRSTDVPEDLTRPYPEASADPMGNTLASAGGSGFGSSAGGGFDSQAAQGAWSDPEKLSGSSDGWTPADPGRNLNMPVIYFAYDSDKLVPSETANLDKIAAYLIEHPTLGLLIEGHCDSRGTDEYNRALGERRANAIRAYLVSRNVADSRLKTLSFGKDKPAVPGSGESIWRQNRRGVPIPMRMR